MSPEEQAVYDAAKALVESWKGGNWPGGHLGTGGYPPTHEKSRELIEAVEAAIEAE